MKARATFACLCLVLLAGCEARSERCARPQADTKQSRLGNPRVACGLLRFVEGYDDGLAEAERSGKPMLLFFTAEWCHYCHQMAGDAFTHPPVVDLSEKFVCVIVDADSAANVCRRFHVAAFPTIQFTSVTGTPLNRIEGKRPGHQVMMAMQAALQTASRPADPSGPALR